MRITYFQPPASVDSVAALRQLAPPAKQHIIQLTGYYTPGDGGGSHLMWVPDSNKVDDNGTVFRPNSQPAVGRWERIDAIADPRWFGAKNTVVDPNFDSTPAIQAMINACSCIRLPPYNTFRLSGQLVIPSDTTIDGYGEHSELFFDWVGRAQGYSEYIRNVNRSPTSSVTDSNIIFRNFKVTGSGDGLPYGSPIPGDEGTTVSGIVMRRVKGLVVEGMEMTQITGISIAHQGCAGARIVNNRVHDVGRDGITGCWWVDRMEDVVIEGNRITNFGDDGIAVISSEDQPNYDVRPRRIAITGNVIKSRDRETGGLISVSITAGSAVVVANDGSPFVASDVGKPIVVLAAGSGDANLSGTIVSVDSKTQITVSFTCDLTKSTAIRYNYSSVGGVVKLIDDYIGSVQTVTTTAGSPIVTCAGAPFTQEDVNKRIVIAGAGAIASGAPIGADMSGWIVSVDSASQITVNFNAVTSTATAIAKYSKLNGRGILCIGGSNIAISGNSINKTVMLGIFVYDDQSGLKYRPQHVTISGNTINDAGRAGDDTQNGNAIRVLNCDDLTICGNTISNSRESGIYVYGCASPSITGNSISGCGSACFPGKFHYGIEVNGDPSIYNVYAPVIAGNTIRGCAAGGIMNAFSRHGAVTGNVCVDNGSYGDGTRHEGSGIIHEGNGECTYAGNMCTDYRPAGSKLQTFGFCYLAGYDGAKLTVMGNILVTNKSYGINLTANPTYIAISANYSPEGFSLGNLTNTVACIKRGNIESSTVLNNFDRDAGGTTHRSGAGSPEGVVTATIGSTFRRTDGGAGTAFYVKESGTGNTGWVGK